MLLTLMLQDEQSDKVSGNQKHFTAQPELLLHEAESTAKVLL